MKSGDSDVTIYTIAYSGTRFLMVWNKKRDGWEMPGGHVKIGEPLEDAARREFMEESGYRINVKEIRDLGHCFVCSAELGEKIAEGEMTSELFDGIPDKISFERDEYEDTVPWAWGSLHTES